MAMIIRTPQIVEEKILLTGGRRRPQLILENGPLNNVSSKPSAQNSSIPPQNSDHVAIANTNAASELEAQEHQQAEIESVRQRAYEEGYAAGFDIGNSEGRDAYVAGLNQLETLGHTLNEAFYRSLEESEDLVISIAFESISKIVGDTFVTPEGVRAIAKEAMSHVRSNSALIIRVNPLDLELIEEGSAFGISSEIDWRGDDSVQMGGCIIESESGTLDARLDSQLSQLKRVLLSARHSREMEKL